jgi:hypothetical protein
MKMQRLFPQNNRNAYRAVIWLSLLLALAVTLALTGVQTPAHAQEGSGYNLAWWTVDSGGETASQGGSYTLGSDTGQAEAAQFTSTGGGYSLQSGFWSGSAAKYRTWYYPVVLK